MSEGDKLLAAIIANPGDDNLRLMYADWCQEVGDDERAAAMRQQIADSRHGVASGPTDLESTNVYISKFSGLSLGWFRGFINCVTCTAEDWFREAANVVPVNPPIELVTLTTPVELVFSDMVFREWDTRDTRRHHVAFEWSVHSAPTEVVQGGRLIDTVFSQRVIDHRELVMARDDRFLASVVEQLRHDAELARTPTGYLNMKWGDKGDQKGHVKKFVLPGSQALGAAAAECEARRDVAGWMREARRFLLRNDVRPDVIYVDREFFYMLMQHIESRADYLGLDMDTLVEDLMFMRIPVRIREEETGRRGPYTFGGLPLPIQAPRGIFPPGTSS